MVSQVESEFRKFQHAFVKNTHVHCDPNRNGDVMPSVFCQINGKPIKFVLTCCPKNKYHYLVNGNIRDGKQTTDQKIATVQNVLSKTIKTCPTCKNLGEESLLDTKYDESLQHEIHAYYDEKYEELKERQLISSCGLQILKNPTVPCTKAMHGFVDFEEAKLLEKCPLCTAPKPKSLQIHSFLDYAVKRWLQTPEGQQAEKEQEELNQSAEKQQAKAPKNTRLVDYTPPVKLSAQPAAPIAPKKNDSCLVRLNGLKRICSNSIKLIACIGLIVLIGMLYVCYKDRIMHHRLVR